MEKTWQHHFPVLSAIVGVTLGLAFVWSGWSAKPAYANGPCQGPTVNHVGTYYDHVVAVYGVSANINGQQPLLCTGSNNSTTASAVWTTLGAGAIGNCGWAQVGYFKRPNLAIKVYAEYNRRSCDSFSEPDYKLVVWGTANSGTHNYKIRYKSGKHVARMWYDNYAIAKTPFDPGVEWGSQPWARMWSGETHDN